MEWVTSEQLQWAVSQLDQAMHCHEKWYKKVLRVLVLGVPVDTADLHPNAHEHCSFGQRYAAFKDSEISRRKAYLELGHAHRKMHGFAAVLLQRVNEGIAITSDDFDPFLDSLDAMRGEYRALREEFVEVLQNHDPLTGARTRAVLLSELGELHAQVKRGEQSSAVVMMDIDHFKRVNDRYGHAGGDIALMTVARCLKGIIRPYDRLYRYGGEEFVISLPGVTLEEAYSAAERMRAGVERAKIPLESGGKTVAVTITASFGVALIEADISVQAAIEKADQAMYRAKAEGRNRVACPQRVAARYEPPAD